MRLRLYSTSFVPMLPLIAAVACSSSSSDDSTAAPNDAGNTSDSTTSTSDSGTSTGTDSGHPATGTDSGTTPPGTDSGTTPPGTDSGTTPPSEGGTPPSGTTFTDDFEADTAGQAPSATSWTLANLKGCSGSAAYSIAVDTTQSHSGKNSVKVTGGDSCGPVMQNTSGMSAVTGADVYTRVYVYLPTLANDTHTPMITLGLTAANVGTSGLDQANTLQLWPRTIGSSSVLFWQTTDSDVLPQPNGAGAATSAAPAANAWTCIETHTSSAGTGTLETWMNSTRVDGVSFIGGTTAVVSGVNDQWMSKPFAPKNFGLGWVVFSGPTATLWFDDVAVGSARIGCN